MNENNKKIVLDAFAAYNARDIEGLLTFVSDDVNWPDGDNRLHGPKALIDYWSKQWTNSRTHDTPTKVTELSDGRINVRLDQVVKDLKSAEISRGSFDYAFELRDNVITRLDIARP